MATPQIMALINALENVRIINLTVDATNRSLSKHVFATPGRIPDINLDNARAAVALEFQSLVQNIRAVKPTDPLVHAFPDIHYKLNTQHARRNWLTREYATTAPLDWSEIADAVFDDVPKIEAAVRAALAANGVPEC